MRKQTHDQLPLMDTQIDHPRAREYEGISRILDANPILSEMVLQDITGGVSKRQTGAEGMTADQVLRAAIIKQIEELIIKQIEEFSYDDLSFHIIDSRCYRTFCRIGLTDKGFKKSALNSNIKAISAETWEAINRILAAWGEEQGIEKGREVRIDCTVTGSNIHEPTDSSLLWDGVRVLSRMLSQAKEIFGDLSFPFTDHRKRAKRRMLGVMNAKNDKVRQEQYADLLKVAHKAVRYVRGAVPLLEQYRCPSVQQALLAEGLAEGLSHYMELTLRLIDQTERRVLHGESVPASEKLVSIFEPHTDIIIKDRRDIYYGHKVCLSSTLSNFITDCLIPDGNPADTTLSDQMLDRQEQIYGRYPLKVALDGGFASRDNLGSAKSKGIKDVCFAKGRGLEVQEMCRSTYVYKRLRRFRAGIESGISWLKRCFGFARCTWKGLASFKSYVWASIVSANLLTLARRAKSTT
jgi:IS5 family transposase